MTISPEKLQLGATYTRADLATIFEEPNLATSREGWYPRDGFDYVPFFVTLDKSNSDPSVAYNDHFEDGLFFWESQNNNTLQSKWVRKLINREVVPLLFIRRVAKVRNQTQRFYYAGRLAAPLPDARSSRPVKFSFEPIDLELSVPPALKSLVDWRPDASRKEQLSASFAKEVSEKRKVVLARSQGFESDPIKRKLIEDRAMLVAARAYERNGYLVHDVSSYKPFDLYCTKLNAKSRRVEVKGTRGDANAVNLTVGEVKSARDQSQPTDLFVVYGIKLDHSRSEPSAQGGQVHLIQNWTPDDNDLEAIQFRYRVPSS